MKICPKCHQENPVQAKFCLHCGAKQSTDAKREAATLADQAERRQLTIFFCDLVDSTPLSERMDPEDYRQMILDYHNAAEEVIDRNGGKVGNYIGDGLLVYFGYPEGLENSGITGVQTAMDVIEAISGLRSKWENQDKNIYLKIRVGIHTGLVIVDDHLALGETVNLAARLEGLAPHNGIVISAPTYRLTKGWFEVKSIGKKQLKGITEPMEVFEVIGKTGAKTRLEVARKRGLSPLVGREKELIQLRDLWEQAKKRKGSSVMLIGEAGIGKSRLTDKLEEEVIQDINSLLLEARCSMNHTHSAFYPLLELIQNDLIGIASSDKPSQRAEKLDAFFGDHPQADSELPSLLAESLGITSEKYPPPVLSPFAKRGKLMKGFSDLFQSLARERNLLLVIEDLHWADASTLEWLDDFKASISDRNLLLLCNTRPHPKGDPKKLPDIPLIKLDRLGSDEIDMICRHQAHGKALPKDVLEKIMNKTEGVPLFVEELTKMVLESDRLDEKTDHFELIGPLSSLDIPSTLQDSLLARLDQLKDVKDIVQMGSVIGRQFNLEMIRAAISENGNHLELKLSKLLNAEIFQRADSGQPDTYQFKHALIQDTAYGSMLRKQRQQLHKKMASVLVQEFQEICENQPEQLAHHYTESDEALPAIEQWLKAGQKAGKTNAAKEAVAHLKKGLELLPKVEDEIQRRNLELDLRLTLGGTYIISHGFPHPLVKETFDQARTLAEDMEVSPKLALILVGILNYYFNTENYQAFDDLGVHMESLSNDPQHGYWFKLYWSHFVGGILCRGDVKERLPYFKKTMEIFDPSLPFAWELTPSGYLPYATKGWWMIGLQIGGYPMQARELAVEQLTNKDKEYRDSTSLYHVYTFPALYGLFARDWAYAQEILEEYLPLTRSFGDPVFTLTAEVYFQIARFFQGEREAFDQAVQLINVCFDIGFKAFAVTMSAFLAEGYLIYDDPKGSIEWIDKILAHVKKTKTRITEAELHRFRSRSMRQLGAAEKEAEEELTIARKIAQEQETRTFELRAAMDLARLKQKCGKTREALSILKESYDWFSEGFDSIDLKEAKELMDEINQVITQHK